jgi:glycogen synthase
MSDNIQETFGLTPLEAMAAGLPVIVGDWDGYKDTVRDGVDGFRIPSLMPPAPLGTDEYCCENIATCFTVNLTNTFRALRKPFACVQEM